MKYLKKRKLHNLKKISIRMKHGHFFYFIRELLRLKKLKKLYVKQCKKERELIQKVKKKKLKKKKKLYINDNIKRDAAKNKKKRKINKRLNDKAIKNNKKENKKKDKTERSNLKNNDKINKVNKIIIKKEKKKRDKNLIQNKLDSINHHKKGKERKKIVKNKQKIKDGNKKDKTEISEFKENIEINHMEKIKNDCKGNNSAEISSDLSNKIFRIQNSTKIFDINLMRNYTNENNLIKKPNNEHNVIELHHNKYNVKELHDNIKLIEKFDSKNKSINNNISKEMLEYFVSKCIDLKNFIVTYNSSFKNIFNNLFNEYMFLKKYINSNHNVYHKLIFFFSCKHYLKKLNYLLSIFYDVIEENDEDLMLEFYKEIKNNRRLLYYIGRILSNYLTCIAYKKVVYIIIICFARVHTVLNCILISEPFKSIIPELLNIINHIKI
ncbi:conserved Plasmodium protein, unknown function [Plasmodium gallinaceum]|uniref:Uncharacterized protein n=1 Tax=Plasmodium gallinaceum TaxID=5849 RepID=A0A1J1H111_PLAGA|nr:conserved Plasmodium protein, unknown function [Plasmodium gallinaceum]CRG98141.1 conserved Plasmodium protein, unknown function [Plasmodium gallinaceum]